MPAISNYDTTVLVSFDRDIHSSNIDTAHLGFSVVWDGINRFNQAPHVVEIKFNKCVLIDSRTLALKSYFKDTAIEYDICSFRNAKNPRLKYTRAFGNIYGALPKDIMDDFEIHLTATNLSYYPNAEHHETIKANLTIVSPEPVVKLDIIRTSYLDGSKENIKANTAVTSPSPVVVLEIIGEIKP